MSSALLKKLGAAAGILVLFWIVYVYRQVPHGKTPFAKGADQAQQIVLEQGGRSLTFRRESGLWKVSSGSAPGYAAEAQLTQTLISGIKNLQVEEEITNRADRAADYDLTPESGTRVRLLNAQGGPLAEGVFGKQAPDFSHLFFRYPDKPNVYLARGLVRGDLGRLDVNYWRSRQLIEIPETKIESIVIEGKGFKTDLVKTSTEAWNVNGNAVDPGLADALVGVLAHSQADQFVDPSAYPKLTFEGLTYARISVKGSGTSAELRIGAQDASTKRYPVSAGKADGLAWMSQSALESLLKKPSAFKLK